MIGRELHSDQGGLPHVEITPCPYCFSTTCRCGETRLTVRTDAEMAAQFREDLRTARQMMAELLDMIEDLGGEADERYYIEMDR